MNYFRRFVIWALRFWGGKFALTHLKRKGLIVYLRALQAIRRSFLLAIAFFCLLQLMILGAVGTFVIAVLLTSQEQVSKLWILLAGFLVFFAVPFVGLAFLFSERVWFKASGIQDYFAKETPARREQQSSTEAVSTLLRKS